MVIDMVNGVFKTNNVLIPDYFDDRKDENGLFRILDKVDSLYSTNQFAVGVVMSHVAIEVATKYCVEHLIEKYASNALLTLLKKELNLNLNQAIHPGHPKLVRILNLFLDREDIFDKTELKAMNYHTTVRNNFCHRGIEPTIDEANQCREISKAIIHKLWLIHRAKDNPNFQQP